jgi:histidine triad (HIT) family protein
MIAPQNLNLEQTMPTDPNCIFCKIVAGQIPVFTVFEDDAVLAFLDISPIVRGHTIIIPKDHHPSIMETPPQTLANLSARLPKISRAVLAATGTKACHLLVNNGSDAMQTVPHLHYHILPRFPKDEFHIPWNSSSLDLKTAGALALEIQAKANSQQ